MEDPFVIVLASVIRNHRTLLLLLAVAAAGCHRRVVVPPPSLFPVSNGWVTGLENIGDIDPEAIEGPLATDGKRILVSTRGGIVYGLDIGTGAIQWKVPGRPGRLVSNADTIVLKQANGTVWRIDSETGSARWKFDTGVAGELPPLLDGARIYVAGKGLVCLDLETGEPVWERRDGPDITSGPVVERAFLAMGRSDGSIELLRKNTGKSVWTYGQGEAIQASPIVDDRGRVLVGNDDGTFLALDMRSGKRLWRWRIGADVRAAGTVFENRVLFTSLENVVYSLDRGNGHMIWRTPLPSRPLFPLEPIGRSFLVVCADSDLVGVDPATGKNLGAVSLRLSADGSTTVIRTPPLRIGARLFVGVSSPVAVTALDLPAGVAP